MPQAIFRALTHEVPDFAGMSLDGLGDLGLAELLAQLQIDGQLRSDTQSLGQLVEQITLTLLFSLDYQRIIGREGESRLVVYQVMMLVAPHLAEESRYAAEHLAQRYLED